MADTTVLVDPLNTNPYKSRKNHVLEIVTHDELCSEGKWRIQNSKDILNPIVRMDTVEEDNIDNDKNYTIKNNLETLKNKKGIRYEVVKEKIKNVTAKQSQSDQLPKILERMKEDEEYARILGIHRVQTSEQMKIQNLNQQKDAEKYKAAKFKCDKCACTFFTKKDLQTHAGSIHSESIGPHECIVCQCRFKSPAELSRHSSLEHVQWACGRCKAIVTRDQWHNHGIKCSFDGYECDVCHKKYSTKESLRRHKPRHALTGVNCHVCDKRLVDKSLLRLHMQRHAGLKLYECDECDMKYSAAPSLWQHKSVKHGPSKRQPLEARYCKECDKHFASKTSLDIHLKSSIHVDKDSLRYACDFCPKKFSSSTWKQMHIDQHHKDSKNYKCQICPKAFSTKHYLNSHIRRTHDKANLPRNFICDLCGAAFLRKKTLTEHVEAIHQKLRLHRCQMCGAKFGFSASLFTHKRLKHTVTPKFKPPPEKTPSMWNTEVCTTGEAVDELSQDDSVHSDPLIL